MLAILRIKNFALVADLTVELHEGLNVITGETGAGKSILIGALNLILGQRVDRTTTIRGDCDACTVEAVFLASTMGARLVSFLEENGLESCEDGQIFIKRTLSASGANKQFVNGSPTTLSVLAALGDLLIDIHGPHDHQSLLNPGQQLAILDAFGGLEDKRQAFTQLVCARSAVQSEKAALIVDEKTYAQQLDLLRFQVSEISAARLEPNEETELEAEYQRSSNAARLLELTQQAAAVLSEDEQSVLGNAGRLGRTIQEIARLDPGASKLASAHQGAVDALQELQGELAHYSDRLQIDPQRLQELEERVNLLHSLKRKYGSTVAEVIAFAEEAQKRLQNLEQRDFEVERLNARLQKLESELITAGHDLSARRRQVIPQLARAVTKELSALGFKRCHFDVSISTANGVSELGTSGFDTVEFQFAPNLGEPPRPLRAIASSGELARVMLGLKTVLAAVDCIPVLVFDEVDANVGGETANAVGEKMRQISQKRQVLCITHLPQVACHATAHYVVSKTIKAGRTISEVALLDSKERVTEVARMLGGQTDAARKHAASLLKTAVLVMLSAFLLSACRTQDVETQNIRAIMFSGVLPESEKPHAIAIPANIKNTAFEQYDTLLLWAINREWHRLVNSAPQFKPGRVTLAFMLHSDGNISSINELEATVTDLAVWTCRAAITRLAPYPSWPPGAAEAIKSDRREVEMTFHFRDETDAPGTVPERPATLKDIRPGTL